MSSTKARRKLFPSSRSSSFGLYWLVLQVMLFVVIVVPSCVVAAPAPPSSSHVPDDIPSRDPKLVRRLLRAEVVNAASDTEDAVVMIIKRTISMLQNVTNILINSSSSSTSQQLMDLEKVTTVLNNNLQPVIDQILTKLASMKKANSSRSDLRSLLGSLSQLSSFLSQQAGALVSTDLLLKLTSSVTLDLKSLLDFLTVHSDLSAGTSAGVVASVPGS